MRWFRRNVRFGSSCALFALAIQLVLSFGHLHFASSAAAAALASAAAEPLAGAPEDQPTTPSKHSRVADYCTICASIHLTGLLTAEPPSVSTLHPSSGERLKVLIEATTTSYSGLPFNARAPPLA